MLDASEQLRRGRVYLIVALMLMVFSYPLYAANILPMTLTLALMFGGSAFIIVMGVRGGSLSIGRYGYFAIWLFAAVYVALNALAFGRPEATMNSWYQITLVLAILVMLVACYQRGWELVVIRVLVAMLLPFAVATLVFYAFPELFAPVKSLLFPNSLFARGYQSGLTTHYSYNGLYCTLGMLLAFAQFFTAEKGTRCRRAWGFLMIVFLVAVFLIGKRQNLVFGFFSMAALYLFSGKKKAVFKCIVFCVFACVALVLASMVVPGIASSLERLIDTVNADDAEDATSGRTKLWAAAISGWERNVLFGNGWNTFSYEFSPTNTVHVAHNELLDQLYGGGIVGCVIVTGCIVFTLIFTWRKYHDLCKERGLLSRDTQIIAVSFVIQLYFVTSGYSIGNLLGSPPFAMPYLLAVGMAGAFYCYERGSMRLKRRVFEGHCHD